MGFKCVTCGATQADKRVCDAPDCGFRLGRFVIEEEKKLPRWEKLGCATIVAIGLIAAVIVYTPSLNQGVVAFFSRALDGLIRWWFRH
jgi:hypothetical protein